jgi:hypothetical protein
VRRDNLWLLGFFYLCIQILVKQKECLAFPGFGEEQKHKSQCIITYNIKEGGEQGAGENFH